MWKIETFCNKFKTIDVSFNELEELMYFLETDSIENYEKSKLADGMLFPL